MTGPSAESLAELEAEVQEALSAGHEMDLPVLGYGEISLVLGWPRDEHRHACKRLPVFPDAARLNSYRRALTDYLDALREAGVRVVETDLRAVERPDGTFAAYVVQPILAADSLAPVVLSQADPAAGHPLVAAVVQTAAAVLGPRLGIDSQLSNWTWEETELTYIDVSTPMLWDERGEPRLDLELLSLAFPWLVRAPLRRFAAPRILDTYRKPRGVFLDLCGNLIKQRLEAWLPHFLEQVNSHVTPPLTAEEVRRYYRSDRRLWASLLALRHLDRLWQRRIRRRPYPFLLPGHVDR
jgi:hypothetical protein